MEKVRAPEGMLRAVANIWEVNSHAVEINKARAIVEAALGWLDKQILHEVNSNTTTWQAGYNVALKDIRKIYLAPKEDDPLVMYFMRHIDDIVPDERERRNRAESAVADYEEHVKRNSPNPSSIPPNEFVECDACSAKPGSPPLCSGCLHNREVINSLKRDRKPQASEVSFGTGLHVSPKSNDFPVLGFTEPKVPEEIKDYMAWCDVYFGDHPQLSELKNVMCGTFRRGQKAGSK